MFATTTVAYWLTALGFLPISLILPVGLVLGVAVGYFLGVAPLDPTFTSTGEPSATARGTILALAGAVLAALIASITVRPDADDYFYVNRSRWVAEQASIPTWNTIYGNESFPLEPAYLLNSYEAVIGLLARTLSVDPTTLTYAIVPPLGSAAATWALWLLLRSWNLRTPDLAFGVAYVWLLFAAVGNAVPSNLFLGRMWQGKVLFFAILLPMIWARAPGKRSDHAALALLCVAAVGLTTSALFVVPPILAVSSLAALITTRRPTWIPLACAAAMGVALLLLPSSDASSNDPGRKVQLSLQGIWETSFGTGVFAIIGVLAVVIGPSAIRDRQRRIAVYFAVSLVAIALSPPVLRLFEASSASPVAWRMIWWLPTAALLGAVIASPRVPHLLTLIGAGAFALMPILLGTSIWSSSNGAEIRVPGAWKVPANTRQQAEALADFKAGSIVVAPIWPSIGLSLATSESFSVTGRPDYIESLRGIPESNATERQTLFSFAFGGIVPAEQVDRALRAVGVTDVCIEPGSYAATTMEELRWSENRSVPGLQCFRSLASSGQTPESGSEQRHAMNAATKRPQQ